MAKVSFTAARLEAFTCAPDKGQTIYWDAKMPGLGFRVTARGARSFIFEARLHGKTLRVTIGDIATWDLGKARTHAASLKVLVDQGKDPREERVAQSLALDARRADAQRSRIEFGQAWDLYVESRKPHWGDRHYEDHVTHASVGGLPRKRGKGLTTSGPLAHLRSLRLSEMTGERIAAWLSQETAKRPTMAALSYRLLRGFVRWCEESTTYRGVIPSEAYRARAVRDAVHRVRPKAGDVLQKEQLRDWFRAVRSHKNPTASAYLQALLLTGARREEMAQLRWEDVDFQWKTLILNDKIEGTGGRTIPLPPYLASILKEVRQKSMTPPTVRRLKRLHASNKVWSPSPWVFHSPTAADGRISEPRSAHQAALAAAGLPHLTVHGLRRSFGTLSEWCEVPVGVVAQIQGHKPSAIAEKHYRRRPVDLLRVWHEKIEEWMLVEAGIRPPRA
ncbi:MAG: preprotein translocase [Variovorax paradoxus]|uniref:Preprotein translocase n=1 Tax=Variovorax paradoxus TaxID=34073 RepID=A0A2W5Q6S5_VARPD|nr:MAG: preprotein translocase [Variovorax paradoxus]